MPLKSMVRCHSIKCHWILNHMHSIGRLWVLVGRILYHFSDKVTYWWKISIFQCPWRSWRYRDLNTVITFGKEKLEWWAYHVVKSLMTCLAVSVQYRCMTVTDIHNNTQTDRQTDILRQRSPRYAGVALCIQRTRTRTRTADADFVYSADSV